MSLARGLISRHGAPASLPPNRPPPASLTPKAVHSFVTLGPQAALCSVVSTSLIRHGEEEGPATVRALCVLNLEGGNESLASPHDPHLKRSILTAGV